MLTEGVQSVADDDAVIIDSTQIGLGRTWGVDRCCDVARGISEKTMHLTYNLCGIGADNFACIIDVVGEDEISCTWYVDCYDRPGNACECHGCECVRVSIPTAKVASIIDF